MVAAAKEWRVRVDRIDSMFTGKKDKPPSIRIWSIKYLYIIIIFSIGALATSLYVTGQLGPSTGRVASWIAQLRGGGDRKFDHGRPVARLAQLLGKPDGEAMVEELNARFAKLPAEEQPGALLKWAAEEIPEGRWCQVTSFGPSGLVALDLMSKMNLLDKAQIATVDTLHLFPETYELVRAVKKHFGLDHLKVFRPEGAKTREEFEVLIGAHLWRADPHLFDFLTKVEPMKRALDEMQTLVWVTGRRKSQGGDRATLRLLEVDPSDGRVKINPLANWGKEEVWGYIKRHKVPYNSLHDQGYGSIGDVVTTEKTDPNAKNEREGRFKGQNRTECGMHVAVSGDSVQQMLKRAGIVKQGYAWDAKEKELCQGVGIEQVTTENFEEVVVGNPANVLLEVYAPWCGHCQQYAPTYREVGSLMGAEASKVPGGVAVCRMDGYQNKVPKEHAGAYPVKGFPTIFLAKAGSKGAPVVYSGHRHDAADVVQWVKDEVGRGPATAA